MRRFTLVRHHDPTGISGTGTVANGIQFPDGATVLRWCTANHPASTSIYGSINDIERLHGHNGATTIEWIDHNGDTE